MGFDFKRFGPEIAKKTLKYFQKKYPELTEDKIIEYLARHHANQPPCNEEEAFVRGPLAAIEKAIARGFLK